MATRHAAGKTARTIQALDVADIIFPNLRTVFDSVPDAPEADNDPCQVKEGNYLNCAGSRLTYQRSC